MEDILNVISLLLILGTIIVFFVIVIRNLLYWIAPSETRTKRLSIIAGVILGGFCITYFIRYTKIIELLNGGKGDGEISGLFIAISKITIKLLMLGTVVVSVIMLLIVIFLFLYHGGKALKKENRGNLAKQLRDKSDELKEVIKTPIVIFAITWGIIVIFFILPILMGNQKEGKNWSIAEVWKDGVYRITSFVKLNEEDKGESTELKEDIETGVETKKSNSDESPFYKVLLFYILIFIIVLGIGIATIRILYSIICDIFTRKNTNTIIDEYSNSIGILAVGIALLLTFQNIDFLDKTGPVIIYEFLKTFALVIFVISLIILTLEIIRLLMDMKEELIRQEAKYLFISLVGHVSVLLLDMINVFYLAVSSALGNTTDDAMDEEQVTIKRKMVEIIEDQIKKKSNKGTFSDFDKKVTKK